MTLLLLTFHFLLSTFYFLLLLLLLLPVFKKKKVGKIRQDHPKGERSSTPKPPPPKKEEGGKQHHPKGEGNGSTRWRKAAPPTDQARTLQNEPARQALQSSTHSKKSSSTLKATCCWDVRQLQWSAAIQRQAPGLHAARVAASFTTLRQSGSGSWTKSQRIVSRFVLPRMRALLVHMNLMLVEAHDNTHARFNVPSRDDWSGGEHDCSQVARIATEAVSLSVRGPAYLCGARCVRHGLTPHRKNEAVQSLVERRYSRSGVVQLPPGLVHARHQHRRMLDTWGRK